MTRDQAKLILQTSRPNEMGATSPLLTEARALLENDAELRAWFQEERAFDDALRRKLKETPVPAELPGQIRERAESATVKFRSRAALLAMAAAVALSTILAAFFLLRGYRTETSNFAAFRNDMGAFLKEFPKLDLETSQFSEVEKWLSQKPWISNTRIPKSLESFPLIGCREINWRDSKAVLLCIMVDGEVIHLFVVPHDTLNRIELAGPGQFRKVGSVITTAWVDGPNFYLAATKGTKEFLQKHIRL